jgi:hypothetical protein
VYLEEELEDLPITDSGRIKDDLDRFCVCSMIAIGRIGVASTGVANAGCENAVITAKEMLNAPKTTTGEHNTFCSHHLFSV